MKTNSIKGKTQLRCYDIPVDVYEREVYLYIGKTFADAAFGAEAEFTDLEFSEDELKGRNVAMAVEIKNKQGRSASLILLAMDAAKEKHDVLSVLVHETLHVSWHMLSTVGIDINPFNHEAQAYLQEHIFKHCKKAIQHYIKTYKLKINL